MGGGTVSLMRMWMSIAVSIDDAEKAENMAQCSVNWTPVL